MLSLWTERSNDGRRSAFSLSTHSDLDQRPEKTREFSIMPATKVSRTFSPSLRGFNAGSSLYDWANHIGDALPLADSRAFVLLLFMACSVSNAFAQASKQTAAEVFQQAAKDYAAEKYVAAVEGFTRASDLGSLEAKWQLAKCYEKELGTRQDHKRALQLMQELAEQDYPEALCSLGFYYATGIGVVPDDAQAHKFWMRGASFGHARCILNVALDFMTGKGVTKDAAKAETHFTRVIKDFEEDPLAIDAHYWLAVNIISGAKTVSDETRALFHIAAAADRNHVEALALSAKLLNEGLKSEFGDERLVKQNISLAFDVYRKAANKGSEVAQQKLITWYAEKDTVTEGFVENGKWYPLLLEKQAMKEAENGDLNGLIELGDAHLVGAKHLPKRKDEGLKILEVAAERGSQKALLRLADYLTFSGEKKRAIQSYCRAIMQKKRDTDLQCELAMMFWRGGHFMYFEHVALTELKLNDEGRTEEFARDRCAMVLLENAYREGSGRAAYCLGEVYANVNDTIERISPKLGRSNSSISQDLQKSREWFQKAKNLDYDIVGAAQAGLDEARILRSKLGDANKIVKALDSEPLPTPFYRTENGRWKFPEGGRVASTSRSVQLRWHLDLINGADSAIYYAEGLLKFAKSMSSNTRL